MKRNKWWTPKSTIKKQLHELRPLPMGRQEFEAWSDRIIAGACIPGATPRSLKFALAEMIMHLKPTQDHCDDAHFIHSLRKGAVNQVAWTMMQELKEQAKKDYEARASDLKNADVPAEAQPIQ